MQGKPMGDAMQFATPTPDPERHTQTERDAQGHNFPRC